MKLTYKGFRHTDGSPELEAKAALTFAQGKALHKPLLLAYTPVGRTNPYQALLYRSFESADIAVSPIVKSWDFPKISHLRGAAGAVLLHIHWTSFVLNEVRARATARKKVNDFKHHIDTFVATGGRIVWTLHNVVPHDSRYIELEMEIQAYLADKAHVIHAMSEASVDMMSELVPLNRSKVVQIPHPNYRGTYEDFITRSEARLALGIAHDERVYVLLGALKAYKGLNRLLDSFEAICERDPSVKRRLLVGGMPDLDDTEVRSFVERCESSPRVMIEAKKVPAPFVQYYMRAADVGLAPYTRMLNSGAILLYQTFDLPVIASSVPAVWEHMNEDIAESVDDDSVEALVAAFDRSERFFERDVRWQVRAYADTFDSEKLSAEFARELRTRLTVLGD